MAHVVISVSPRFLRQDFLKTFSPDVFRLFCLRSGYRSGEAAVGDEPGPRHPDPGWGGSMALSVWLPLCLRLGFPVQARLSAQDSGRPWVFSQPPLSSVGLDGGPGDPHPGDSVFSL